MPPIDDVGPAPEFERGKPRAAWNFLAVTAIVFCAYFIAGKLGQATSEIRSSNLGPVWPAYGVALAAVVLCGSRAWLGILAAAFVVASQSSVSILAAAFQAMGATLAALTGGALLQRAGFDRSLSRLHDALSLIINGALVSAMVSATIGVTALYATGAQPYAGIVPAWLIYWMGDATGVLLVTPLALTAWAIRHRPPRGGVVEFGALVAILSIACFVIFGDLPLVPVRLHVLAFAVLPFVMWAAIRFGVTGVAVSTLLVAVIATVETALGYGPFAQDTTFINAALLDVFFAVLTVSGVTLAAVIAEREHVERARARLAQDQSTLEAVRESEDKLRLILDSTAEAIYGVDLEGRCTFCNPACLRALGYDSVGQLLGRTMHDLIHHSRSDGTPVPLEQCALLGVMRAGTGVHLDDETMWRANGTSFPAECWSYPQMKGRELVGAVIAFFDITQRKEAELQAAALREELVHLGRVTMLDALAGSLAHEINQPLTAVMANTEAALRLLEMPSPPLDDLRDALADIRSDNQRAGDVVHRMRALLRKGATRHERIDVNATVAEVLKLIKGTTVSRGITVDVELAPSIKRIVCDRIQFQQVVLNLLMNACDATQDQETSRRRITLRTAQQDIMVAVHVEDRGPGVSDAELALIFEPFHSTKKDGMGLGLSICRAIVRAHGGSLDVKRNPDAGLTFSAAFPIQPPRLDTPRSLVAPQFQKQS